MARITVEDCLEHVENRFALVLLVAKRAKQLIKGAPGIETNKDNKYIVNSLREVASGHVYFDVDREGNGAARRDIERDLNK